MPLALHLLLDQAQIVQGYTLALRARTSRVARVSMQVDQQTLGVISPDGREHFALLGIGALAKPGPRALAVQARSEDGQEAAIATRVFVVAGTYGQEIIRLEPSVARLLDPKLTLPEQERLTAIFAAFTPKALWQGAFDWPCAGPITSEFGTRRSYGGPVTSYHEGLDIGGPSGTPILAPAAGMVVLAETLTVRGGTVILDHGAGVFSSYYHLESIVIPVGVSVQRGDLLGKMGATGVATGPHLHWELHVGGIAVNPQEWTERAFP